jgi:hypothetical protein
MAARMAIAVMFLMAGIAAASATVRIADDTGGQIGDYLAKFKALRASGERVEIDGTCASACTMLLGTVPRSRICVTPRAVLEFHSAWDPTPSGGTATSEAGNQILWSTYPDQVRKWVRRHGGLNSRIIKLSGAALAAMYSACPR